VERIVVKVGTSTLTHQTGHLNLGGIEKLVRQITDLHNQGKEVLLVTSGAVGAGMGKLGLTQKPKTMPEKQALAAVGQGLLMQVYAKLFSEYGKTVSQVLLTREDLMERKRYLNARHALLTLLNYRMIPVINENDVVAVDELKFGDNDTLSALVASLIDADLLIILSDIEGLYTEDPRKNSQAQLISLVSEITPEIEALAGGAGSLTGTGGMFTKVQAAKIATNSGVTMLIANGGREGIVGDLLAGKELGTLFLAKEHKLHCRKRWLAFGIPLHGRLFVDEGAQKALVRRGKSLLPSGIVSLEGCFQAGDLVAVLDREGKEIARGLVNYSSEEIDLIKGASSKDIITLLGHKYYDEVIHRDNLAVITERGEEEYGK